MDDVAQDAQARKLPAFRKMLEKFGIERGDAAFVGDDLPDLAILRAVGLPVAVGNAVKEVREAARSSSRARAATARCASSPSCCSRRAASGASCVDEYVATRSVGGLEVLR